MKRRVYLSGPIAGCDDETANQWRSLVTLKLHQYGIDSLNPMKRDYRNADVITLRNEIVELDKHDIDSSDAMIVYFGKQSTGTAMEVLYAWERHKPVVTVVPPDMVEHISPWLVYHSTTVISAETHEEMIDSAVDWIASNINEPR